MSFLLQLMINMAFIIGFVAIWMMATASAGILVAWAAKRVKARTE